jgi:hypothetical protein
VGFSSLVIWVVRPAILLEKRGHECPFWQQDYKHSSLRGAWDKLLFLFFKFRVIAKNVTATLREAITRRSGREPRYRSWVGKRNGDD